MKVFFDQLQKSCYNISIMSRKCVVCSKRPKTGNNVSHSNRKTKRIWKPNLQKVNILLNGKKRKEYVLCKIISMMVVNVELMKAFRFVDHTPYRLFFFRNTEEMDAGVLYQMELNPMPEASPMIAMIASE